ncbi:MAG: peroxiredoxin [Planctomycetes bacterium]|nr:peroxiredoxin [Planctomycetota bacterium]
MIGERAPDCELVDPDGKPYRLSQAWAAGPACLVFYPGDGTRVCTAQLCEYRDHWSEFAALGATVLGINPQSHDSHRGFARDHSFPFPLLSDPSGTCCKAYRANGWWSTHRLVVVIDRTGAITHHRSVAPWRRQRASELLDAVRASS